MSQPKIALLGLGTMGSGMAANLLNASYDLTVYNRTSAKAEPLARTGATVAASPAQAAAGAEVVISMLADDQASRLVWMGPSGALEGCEPNAVLVESGTVSVGWLHELAQGAARRKCALIDAPVTGSRAQAESGQLLFLAGGNKAALQAVRPVLRAMSRDVLHLGPLGSGLKMKLINNFLCGVQAAALAEAMAWIERSGLDESQAMDVLVNGAPGSPLVRALAARMAGREYSVNFLLRLMAKDLAYAQAEANSAVGDLQTAKAAAAVFNRAVEHGDGERDMAAVVEQFRSAPR
jgi:3-hydroxyisobutyrate dehydrogenase